MSEKELVARGAQCVTGDLILRNTVVGRYRNGVFAITPEGEAELDVLEVVAKEAAPAKPKSEPKSKPKAVAKPAAPAPTDDGLSDASLDALLNDPLLD